MSKRHTQLLQEQHMNYVVPNDQIWKAAQEEWNDLEPYVIARGFVLAYIILLPRSQREREVMNS
jgi:hypothetical protein